MRVTMDAKINGGNKFTDADFYNPRQTHRISVASKPFSQKIIVHRVTGYNETDMEDSRTVLPTFVDFLLEFTDYDNAKLAGIGD
jgi:hypothetical protein